MPLPIDRSADRSRKSHRITADYTGVTGSGSVEILERHGRARDLLVVARIILRGRYLQPGGVSRLLDIVDRSKWKRR